MGRLLSATTKAADAPDIDAGFYDARFDGLDQKFITGGQFGDGDRFVWSFTLLDDEGAVLYDEGEPIEIEGLTSLSLNVVSQTQPKAVRYLKALMTADEFAAFAGGEGIDAEALVGRVGQVEVILKDSGWPTIINVLPKRVRRVGRSSASSEGDAS